MTPSKRRRACASARRAIEPVRASLRAVETLLRWAEDYGGVCDEGRSATLEAIAKARARLAELERRVRHLEVRP